MDTIRDMIAAQRAELAEVLAGLRRAELGRAHALRGLAGARGRGAHHDAVPVQSGRRFALELAKSRGRFNEMADRVARRDAAAMSPADLTGAVRSNVGHPWKPPGGGFTGALAHDLIHGLDITVPLGLARPVPEERLRLILPGSLTDRSVKFFGVDVDGIELRAQRHGLGARLRRAAGRRRGRSAAGAVRPDAATPVTLTGEPSARFSLPR